MDETIRQRKLTVKLTNSNDFATSKPPLRTTTTNISRPPSPDKLQVSAPQSPAPDASFRPKAKINSTATVRKFNSTVGRGNSTASKTPLATTKEYISTPGTSRSPTPRSNSPFKATPKVQNGTLSPTFQARPRVLQPDARSKTPVSAPVTPEHRSRSLTTSSEAGYRGRQVNFPLHHAISFSSLPQTNVSPVSPAPPKLPSEPYPLADQEPTETLPVRIRSKVTGLAKNLGDQPSSPTPSLHSSTRPATARTRAPSISSNVSQPGSLQIYPITTATPAANPYRFAKPKGSPLFHHVNQRDEFNAYYDKPEAFEPSSVPPPPHSPSISALSISSRSSLSHSSVSHVHGLNASQSDESTVNKLDIPESVPKDGDSTQHYDIKSSGDIVNGQDAEDDADVKVRAEAKSNRKIADLEITNRSLLAINSSLEATKHRQAKEIRELRRKLRESRLILPPRTFLAVKAKASTNGGPPEEEESESDDDAVEGAAGSDDVYNRIKIMLEDMLESGKRALETTKEDFMPGANANAKVLTPEEVRSWRDSSDRISDHEAALEFQSEANTEESDLTHSAQQVIQDPNSEEEVEAMTIPSRSRRPSPSAPPILVTEST